jgi:hypothetical protein
MLDQLELPFSLRSRCGRHPEPCLLTLFSRLRLALLPLRLCGVHFRPVDAREQLDARRPVQERERG